MEEAVIGNGKRNDTCFNVHIINEPGIPILGMGLKGMVVFADSESILVSAKKKISYIKPFVETTIASYICLAAHLPLP